MPERTSITTDAIGRRVTAKVAGNAEEAARLTQEASVLDAGRHPGVVELVGVDGHGVGAVLLTGHVDGPTLAQVGLLPLEEGAGLLAALATTLADLHGLGLVHGAICPEHVILGPGGRPVLCSFGYGGRVGEPPGETPPTLGKAFADPCREWSAALDPAFDVFGLGALARFLAPDPPPGHVLASVAADATAADPLDRPTARAVADALQREVPAARLPRGLVAPPPAPARPVARPADPLDAWRRERSGLGRGRERSRGSSPTLLAALAVAVVVAGVVTAGVLVSGRRGAPAPALAAVPSAEPPAPAPEEAAPGPTTTRAGPVSSPPTTAVRSNCPAVGGLLQADIDGDGCPEALRYADGLLQTATVSWALGQAGDQVAIGNWGCQGTRTLALFRPSTGQVFRFDGWAGPGHDLNANVVAVVAGGQALRAADLDRDGCHEVVVERATGPAEIIRLPRVQG
jgi:hypothetical protein